MSISDGRHDDHRFQDGSTDNTDALPARGAAVAVHACSRIGMQANPPRSTFSGWLRRR